MLLTNLLQKFVLGFLIGSLKQKSAKIALIINLVPLVGVLFWQWSVLEIVLSYVIECGVMVFYSAVMMSLLGKEHYMMERTWLFKLWFIPLYLIFFGVFIPGFGGFLFEFLPHQHFSMEVFYTITGTMLLGHGLMFITKFKSNRKFYFDYFIQEPMFRLFYIFFMIAVGSWVLAIFKSHLGFLLMLIALKILIDVRYYGRPLVDTRLFKKNS
jgi:hypothetical protein